MGDIVNLNQFRKQRERENAKRRARVNRAKHGLDKGERRQITSERERRRGEHEGNRLDGRSPTDEPSAS